MRGLSRAPTNNPVAREVRSCNAAHGVTREEDVIRERAVDVLQYLQLGGLEESLGNHPLQIARAAEECLCGRRGRGWWDCATARDDQRYDRRDSRSAAGRSARRASRRPCASPSLPMLLFLEREAWLPDRRMMAFIRLPKGRDRPLLLRGRRTRAWCPAPHVRRR